MFGIFKKKPVIEIPKEPAVSYRELREQVITLLELVPDDNEHKARLARKLKNPFKKKPHRDLTPELTSFFNKIKRMVENG